MVDLPIGITEIKKLLPHRYPFLLVDKVVELIPNEKIIAIKNVTANEEFFNGHFPHQPIMPGVLIVEALAQSAALYYLLTKNLSAENSSVYFMSIESCKFRKPVVPGDVLHLEVSPIKDRGKVVKVECKAYCEGTVVTESIMTAMLT